MSGALLGEWSRLLVASLFQAGLRHAVVSPGSRSTPFAWALATQPGLACHSLIDERAAGFFALGIARVTGEPALVLSTSGSAAANYFPAVVEASLARLPLLVLTADRPFELQGVEAPQTIDQVKLYGDYVRRFFELGVPDASAGALAAVKRLAGQALLGCLSPEPGPVQVNARARKPLEPSPPESEAERELARSVDALIGRGPARVHAPARAPATHAVTELARALARARRGVVVTGPAPLDNLRVHEGIHALAEKLGMPLYAEAPSQLRFGAASAQSAVDALDWLLRSPKARATLGPDCVLCLGSTPTSSGLEQALGLLPNAELHIVAEYGYPDAASRARSVTLGPTETIVAGLLAELEGQEPAAEQLAYRDELLRANARVWQVVDTVTADRSSLDEPAAVRAAVEATPPGGLLIIGNSLPVREVDAYVRAESRGIGVLAQRGANGIDGLIAGAAGAAAASGKPALLLLGDVSFAHDLGGLAAAKLVETPLAIVVIDNDGGRIFEQLPLARLLERDPARAALWLTPPGLAFEHAGPLFGLAYAAPKTPAALREALAGALERRGASIVHARVPAHGARDAQRAILAALESGAP